MAFVKVVGGSEVYNFRVQSSVHLYSKNWSFSISNTGTLSHCRPERHRDAQESAPQPLNASAAMQCTTHHAKAGTRGKVGARSVLAAASRRGGYRAACQRSAPHVPLVCGTVHGARGPSPSRTVKELAARGHIHASAKYNRVALSNRGKGMTKYIAMQRHQQPATAPVLQPPNVSTVSCSLEASRC
jgi:hypothetical protein